MKRSVRRYVEKMEALDFAAGTYHSRRLPPRAKYNRKDFFEYLNAMDSTDEMLDDITDLLDPEDENFFISPPPWELEENAG